MMMLAMLGRRNNRPQKSAISELVSVLRNSSNYKTRLAWTFIDYLQIGT
jgi:hypothetical protein